ncbi:MAG: portal protein, partial [Beijerinckiaceae bacterium]
KARDIAYESAVRGGVGFYRVTTDYANQDDFDLDIFVKPIRNFSGAYCDPSATELDRRDSLYWFVPESMHEDVFERRFPRADMVSFYDDAECSGWREAGRIVVAEYWYKVPEKQEIWSLSTGEVVKPKEAGITVEMLAAQQITVTRKRTIDGHKVMSCLTNGHEFLTDPVEFPCKFIPIIPVFGNIDCIDGEDRISGAVAHGKDSQRLHDLHRTAIVESIAKAPKAPYVAKKKWINGYEHMWNAANSEDYPVLFVADDAEEIPVRSKQAEVPVALMQAASMDNEDMKASNGQNDASLGARSNETSGIAIQRRQQQGNTASYNYLDNLTHAIQFEAEIVGDMIPRVIDTPRVVRTLGQDGGEKWVQLYKQVKNEFGQTVTLNDISKGKYDYTVTTGPSYATQRMEMAEMFAGMVGQVGGAMPELSALLAYMAVKNTDTQDDEFQAA